MIEEKKQAKVLVLFGINDREEGDDFIKKFSEFKGEILLYDILTEDKDG